MQQAVRTRYSTGAMIFHWLIAVAVIVNWRIVEAAEHAAGPDRGALMGTHKAIGISILLFTLARLAWRWMHPVPPLASTLAAWERILARSVHVLFYVLLVGLPLGGWLANSYMGNAVDMFGAFEWPALPVGPDRETGGAIFDLHATGGKALLLLVALHILGALKHTLIDRDGNLFRMLPFGTPKV